MDKDSLQQNINDINKNSPVSFTNGSSQVGAKSHKVLITGIACGVAGLLIGALGVFGIMKLNEEQSKCVSEAPDQPAPTKPFSSTGAELDFLKLENNSDNIIYSPLSIRYGLALLSAGAEGETAEEINKVLGDANLTTYQNEEDVLSLANAVFIKNDFEESVLPDYISTVTSQYDSEVIYDDFASSDTMDKWVGLKTFGLIDNIGAKINPKTVMVLANALAIQMDWQYDFDSEDTLGRSFYYDDGEEIIATTMQKTTSSSDINYYVDDDITVISMPLEETDAGTQLEFDAIMPSSNLGEYIEKLDLESLNDVLNNTIPASTPEAGIHISIPKFKFEHQLDFVQDLKTLGIKEAFSEETANFSKMATQPLYVSDAIHKANIDFSEEGIKAAAITVFVMNIATALPETDPTQPISVIFDHPFMFAIRDKNDGTIWFTGAVYQPNLWEDDEDDYYR